MDIQRWTHDGIYMTTQPDGRYVEYADHLADWAELVRLLKEYREEHRQKRECELYQNDEDLRCPRCRAVDALEGMK